jgi:hypothetical protein
VTPMIVRMYERLSKIGKARVNYVFPDAHDDDGYLYTIGDAPPREMRDGKIQDASDVRVPVSRQLVDRADQ